jgi:hypothetical protein
MFDSADQCPKHATPADVWTIQFGFSADDRDLVFDGVEIVGCRFPDWAGAGFLFVV